MSETGRSMPLEDLLSTTQVRHRIRAYDQFSRVFDLRAEDRVLCLTDPKLDPRVVAAVRGLADARGAEMSVFEASHTRLPSVPAEVVPLLRQATLVVSTWFCSILDPLCIALRAEEGQRWVKITYFRNLDLLDTPQARFPIEIVSQIIRATAARFPRDQDWKLDIKDPRGGAFQIGYTAQMTDALLDTSRWRGQLTASLPGAYVHYLPTHGPNLYQRNLALLGRPESTPLDVEGTLYPQWAVGFPSPFAQPVGVRFARDQVVEVLGDSEPAKVLREMLIGGRLIELGCGFNPGAPRREIYPAGSNAPGALHFGIDLAAPSDYLRRVLPDWEEPPTHVDLCWFDATVHADATAVISDGELHALRDPEVVQAAAPFGDAEALLHGRPR